MKAIATLFICALAQSTYATSFNALYVFGSSWSDTRNGIFWQGHFSNGPMWPEFLSTNLGLPYIATNNFAFGGSQSSVVLNQATNFRPSANPERSLFHFWAGYTDFLRNPDNLTNDLIWNDRIRSWVGTISNAVVQLYGKGARSIVVPNVFDRSREPWCIQNFGTNSLDQFRLRHRISSFNTALAGTLDRIDRTKPDLRLYTLDMQTRFDELVTNSTFYGFTKTYPSAVDDPLLTDKSYTGPGQNYLFWDRSHATSKAHVLIAAWNLEAITNSMPERLSITVARNGVSVRMKKLLIGREYTLQRSPDLNAWHDLHTFTATAGTNQWFTAVGEMSPAFLRLNWKR